MRNPILAIAPAHLLRSDVATWDTSTSDIDRGKLENPDSSGKDGACFVDTENLSSAAITTAHLLTSDKPRAIATSI